MSDTPIPQQSLDLRGLKCPLPVLKARRAIKDMTAGHVLEIYADDPAATLDFAHFCETTGNALVKSEADDQGVLHFLIRVEAPGTNG